MSSTSKDGDGTLCPQPTSSQYQALLSQAQSAGGIKNKQYLAMFLAEIIWESDCLKATSEEACVNADCSDSYPITPGIGIPGQVYYGRGYMQLTWDYNYKACSYALYNDNRL